MAVTLYRDKYADKALPIYAIILFVFATMCNSYSFQIKKKKKERNKKRGILAILFLIKSYVLLYLFFSSIIESFIFVILIGYSVIPPA